MQTQHRVLLGKGVQLLCYTDTGPNHKKVGLKIKAKTIRKKKTQKRHQSYTAEELNFMFFSPGKLLR